MAKKKAKQEMKPAKQQKTKSNNGMIVGIVVVAIVIIALVLLLRGGKEAATPTGPTGPTEPSVPGKRTVELAPTPDFNEKCTSADKITAVTLSYIAGSCNTADGSVSFTMKNPTKSTDVEGVYFEATSTSGRKSYVVDSEVIEPSASKTYTVNLNDLAAAIGETVTDFVVYPAQAGMACRNGRSIIIKAQTCQ